MYVVVMWYPGTGITTLHVAFVPVVLYTCVPTRPWDFRWSFSSTESKNTIPATGTRVQVPGKYILF